MLKHSLTAAITRLVIGVCALALIFTSATRSFAQADIDNERQAGFKLLREGKFAEAQQKFEKLTAANPSDGNSQFGLGYCLIATSKNISDENQRRQARIRLFNTAAGFFVPMIVTPEFLVSEGTEISDFKSQK